MTTIRTKPFSVTVGYHVVGHQFMWGRPISFSYLETLDAIVAGAFAMSGVSRVRVRTPAESFTVIRKRGGAPMLGSL